MSGVVKCTDMEFPLFQGSLQGIPALSKSAFQYGAIIGETHDLALSIKARVVDRLESRR
jgi:hypothetical protein